MHCLPWHERPEALHWHCCIAQYFSMLPCFLTIAGANILGKLARTACQECQKRCSTGDHGLTVKGTASPRLAAVGSARSELMLSIAGFCKLQYEWHVSLLCICSDCDHACGYGLSQLQVEAAGAMSVVQHECTRTLCSYHLDASLQEQESCRNTCLRGRGKGASRCASAAKDRPQQLMPVSIQCYILHPLLHSHFGRAHCEPWNP